RVATEILFGNREASVQRRIPTPFFFVLIVLCAAAVIVIALLMKSFATFMDLTAVLVFLVSPYLAILNHRAIFHQHANHPDLPSSTIKVWSLVSIVILSLTSLLYFYLRLV
ncbi:MAG: hypothetical protein AAF197_07300, partial [Pseudomonadota bacterium]